MATESLSIFLYGMLSFALLGCGLASLIVGKHLLSSHSTSPRPMLGTTLALSALGWGWLAYLSLPNSNSHMTRLQQLVDHHISFQMLADAKITPQKLLDGLPLEEVIAKVEQGKNYQQALQQQVSSLSGKLANLKQLANKVEQLKTQQHHLQQVNRALLNSNSDLSHQLNELNQKYPTAAGTTVKNTTSLIQQDATEAVLAIEPTGGYLPNMVLFDVSDYQLHENHASIIVQTSTWLRNNPTAKLVLEGYADSQGDEDFNHVLAWRRSEAVKEALMSHGITEERLTTKSFGEGDSRSTTSPSAQLERRVCFRVITET